MDTQITAILSALVLVLPAAWAQEFDEPETAELSGEALVAVSSRSLFGDAKTEWIDSIRAELCVNQRDMGPFGLPQDPDAEAVKPEKKKIKKGAFLKAIAAIKVNTVMPSDNKFTIGSREFIEGDVFPLIKNQRQFNIEVVAIKSDNILFKNVDTGEHAKRNLISLPSGMKQNSSLVAIQGVFPANKKNVLPLNLDDEPLPLSRE